MASPSAQQAFGYGQPVGGSLGMGALGQQQQPQRSLASQQFPGRLSSGGRHLPGHVTPTNTGIPSFPTSLPNSLPPQQLSPTSLLSLSSRGLPRQLTQDMKRMMTVGMPVGTGGGGGSSLSGMSGFGMPHNGRNFSHSLLGTSMQNASSYSSNPALDLSEFPSLTNRGSLESSTTPSLPSNPMTGRPAYVRKANPHNSFPYGIFGMVKQPTSETNEFQIHSEDFPALPGSQNQDSSQDLSKSLSDAKEVGRFPGDKSQGPKRGIQTTKDGRVTNIPNGMVTDQFGMVGLLTFIRAAETDQNLVSLALGSDLTTLGLNLNSPENLYPSFGGPWSDHACRPQDIEYNVPSEYLINQNIKDKLAPIKLNRYGEDLLFFLFYMYSGDILQVAAAVELYQRDWRFHKDERVWITRAPGMVPTEKSTTYERGTYYFFDAVNWRKVAKEFHLDYERLEERPHLPQLAHYNPSQPSMIP